LSPGTKNAQEPCGATLLFQFESFFQRQSIGMVQLILKGDLSMKKMSVIAILFGATIFCGTAQAADLTGTWMAVPEKSHGALSGRSQHNPDHTGEVIHIPKAKIPWTLKITSQQGTSFHGQWCSNRKCEKLVGTTRKDGSMLMADEDSTFFATMYENEMELCVVQPGKSLQLSICHMMKKK
jgi:hypothetical protein